MVASAVPQGGKITNIVNLALAIPESGEKVNSNFYCNTSVPIPPNPLELLDSEKMKVVIKELNKQANLLIFDSSPVIGFADSLNWLIRNIISIF